MAKTFGFLTGLVVGAGAAYAAFKSLSPEKQEEIATKTRGKINGIRDTAIDYAYTATDKLENAREHVASKRESTASPVDLVAKSYELADKAKAKVSEVVTDVKSQISDNEEAINDEIAVDLTDESVPSTNDVKTAFDSTKEVKTEVLTPLKKDETSKD